MGCALAELYLERGVINKRGNYDVLIALHFNFVLAVFLGVYYCKLLWALEKQDVSILKLKKNKNRQGMGWRAECLHDLGITSWDISYRLIPNGGSNTEDLWLLVLKWMCEACDEWHWADKRDLKKRNMMHAYVYSLQGWFPLQSLYGRAVTFVLCCFLLCFLL